MYAKIKIEQITYMNRNCNKTRFHFMICSYSNRVLCQAEKSSIEYVILLKYNIVEKKKQKDKILIFLINMI